MASGLGLVAAQRHRAPASLRGGRAIVEARRAGLRRADAHAPRLLLDADEAARSAAQARIYSDLGFILLGLIVEDVITSGESASRAIVAVQEAGGEVLGVLAVVDREEGGRKALESRGLNVTALIGARALDLKEQT